MSDPWPHLAIGPPGTPPIVFLHGFLGRGLDWLPVARHFADRFRCILPDLPGHGKPGACDPGRPLRFPLLNQGLLALLDEFRLDSIILAGYSLGGRAALHFACQHPDRVSALVLESTSPGIEETEERQARARVDDERAAHIRAKGLPAFLETWYRAGLWGSLQERPALLRRLIEERAGQDPELMARVIADLSPGRMQPLWDCLPGLSMPVLLISGALDEKYMQISRRMASAIPDARLALIEGAGHNTHMEQPERFLEALIRFLAQGTPWRAKIV